MYTQLSQSGWYPRYRHLSKACTLSSHSCPQILLSISKNDLCHIRNGTINRIVAGCSVFIRKTTVSLLVGEITESQSCENWQPFSSSGLRHRQQDLRFLLPLLCHQVRPGGNQEGPQAPPWLRRTLQMWASMLKHKAVLIIDTQKQEKHDNGEGEKRFPLRLAQLKHAYIWRYSHGRVQ